MRRHVAALAGWNAQVLSGKTALPHPDRPDTLILCDILSLGLSAAIALAPDASFGMVGAIGDDIGWDWVPAPPDTLRPLFAAHRAKAPYLFPIRRRPE